MSESVSLTLIREIVSQVRRHVVVDEDLVKKRAGRRGVSLEVARSQLLVSATKVALKYSGGDYKRAGTALIITQGKVNRLPQCARLLQEHSPKVVKVAYEVKDDLAISNASLQVLCDLVENTDCDAAGEAQRIQLALDEIASQASTKRRQFYLNMLLCREVKKGRLIEAVCDEIIESMESPDEGKERLRREESYE